MISYNHNCSKCRLHETAKSVCVSGRGLPNASILFVGEAPGQEEDQAGRPFVGPAGQLLDQAIKEYGLEPCFISNSVKCRPPGDRKPRVDEVQACRPYLVEEIKSIKPKVIVCLGNTALQALTGKVGVSSYSGQVVKEVGGIKVFSLYHPSFILREPGKLPLFEMHLRELKKCLNGHARAKEAPIQVSSVAPLLALNWLREAKGAVAWDYETDSLKEGHIRCAGFYDGQKSFVVDATKPGFKEMMVEFLESEVPKIAHNSAFEIWWSVKEFGVEPNNIVHDTFLMQHLVDENASKDLESMASQYFQADKWGIDGLMLEKGWTFATIPYDYLYHYCGLDVYWTYRIARHLAVDLNCEDEGVQLQPFDPYQQIKLPLARLCARLEHTGIRIDSGWADIQEAAYAVMLKSQLNVMNKMDVVAGLVKSKPKGFVFNPNSGQQIREIVFKRLAFHTRKRTKGGLDSTDQKVLEKFKGKHPFIDSFLDWKGLETVRNNYLAKFPTYADENGVVHPGYNPCGTVTGRLAATEPPSQTIPDDPRVRGMVISRFKAGALISSDFKQLELRILMNEADDKDVIALINKGVDLHGVTAERVFGKGFTKDERDIAKTMNFAIGYGIEADSLAFKFGLSYEEAENLIDRFWKGYAKAYLWMQAQHKSVSQNGWIVSRFGVVRHLPELPALLQVKNPPKNIKYRIARLLRQAGNHPIQNAGAEINNLACIQVDRVLRDHKAKSVFCLPVHDSVMVDSPGNEIKRASALCKRVMTVELKKQLPWLKVNLDIDQSISYRWCN